MSSIGQFNNKNPPWGRANNSPSIVNQPNPLQQQIMNQNALNNMNASGMVQFQQQHQQQVFQNAMGLQQQNLGLGLQQMANNAMGAAGLSTQLASNQIFQQVGAVTYPNPRGLNPTAFQTQSIAAVPPVQNNSNVGTKQRVFTGTVTKVHDNFGFVDEDVFFQINACVKGSNPMVGDRVLVEASYNPTMPFKWNATRIQVLPMSNQPSTRHSNNSKNYNNSNSNVYNAVPPPNDNSNGNFGRNNQRSKAAIGRGRERSRDREREEDEIERKRRREERMREREKEEKKSPLRRRSRSPKARRRSRIVPRYMVQIPKIALDLNEADVLEIRRRYTNLYIPSDFFYTHFRWVDAFPSDKPFTMNKPCFFHIMNKEVDAVVENNVVLEPPDADYLYSAKVMLMSMAGLDELYQKCCAMAEDKDKRDRESEERDFVHPARLLNFLVGLRGKNETMAIGGAWSPSLDGENPDKDPSVLIKTAIRTCKALTGIDLSSCTQWYRFVELYYRRSESTHKGRTVPARVETVVLFLPDVWSCVPTRLEWDGLHQSYKKQLERKLKAGELEGDEAAAIDEKEDTEKSEPTHYSQLDPKSMVVNALRTELKARGINAKGLKSQLVARLAKALKAEAETAEDPTKEVQDDGDADAGAEEKRSEAEEKKLDEKEKALLEKRYTLPEQQHILVHPSRTAKSGKFDCTIMSLSLLLDYRPEDTKEHSFEVSLFAELFNEMLMRDFGFNIYRALFELPDKVKDEKKKRDDDKKSDSDRKSDDSKGKKDDEKKKDDDKKEEKEHESKEKEKKSDDVKEEKREKREESEKKKEPKKDDKKSDESEEDDDYDEEDSKDKKKDKEKRKKERVKMYTKDKHLLLSFIYFDQTHCGYIFDKDIEDLLYTLGLNLSRAQVRKLVGKVVTRDSLHYRKLTDKPKENNDLIVIDEATDKDVDLHDLAVGNKKLLPIFSNEEHPNKKVKISEAKTDDTPTSSDGLVTYRGALVDVGKLISQLERSEKARLETESRMVSLKSENHKLTEKYNKSNSTIKHLNSDLKENKEKLRNAEDSLNRITAFSKLYQTTLVEIRDKVDPVLKSTSNMKEEPVSVKKDADKDKKHEESKSRWEKEIKQEDPSDSDQIEVKKES